MNILINIKITKTTDEKRRPSHKTLKEKRGFLRRRYEGSGEQCNGKKC